MNLKATLTHVLTTDYIFDFNFMPLTAGDRLYMVIGLVAVAFAAIFEIFSIWSKNPVTRNMWHKFSSPLGVFGILEVMWYGFRYENVKLFGSHFAAWLIGIIILVWFINSLMYAIKKYPAEKENWEKTQIKLKYMK